MLGFAAATSPDLPMHKNVVAVESGTVKEIIALLDLVKNHLGKILWGHRYLAMGSGHRRSNSPLLLAGQSPFRYCHGISWNPLASLWGLCGVES
jgi:hypothetical protein